jgi:osmotically-inducible protein OsmY
MRHWIFKMLNNTELQQAVRDEFAFDPSLAETEITVSAADGAISLTGSVPSYAQKHFAAKAAQRVAGVRKVMDKIEVKLPTAAKVTDADLTTRAHQSLLWSAQVPAEVKVKVQDGAITLMGEVPFRYQKVAAERTLGRLQGVRNIINQISLKPSSAPPQGAEANITKALKRLAVNGEGITVSDDHGKITLNGTVPNTYQRELAEHVAWSQPGVVDVRGNLSIN